MHNSKAGAWAWVFLVAAVARADLPSLHVVEPPKPVYVCRTRIAALASPLRRFQPQGYIPTGAATAIYGTGGTPTVYVYDTGEIPGTRMLVFSERRLMRVCLSRASTCIEHARFLDDAQYYQRVETQPGASGYDLRGVDLMAFYRRWAAARETWPEIAADDPVAPMLRLERDFWERWLLPQISTQTEGGNVTYLAFDAGPRILDVGSHELLHAQFFQIAEYREATMRFWREQVTPEDRARFLDGLVVAYFNIKNDETLAANEFMAYLLEANAYEDLKKSSRPEFRAIADLVPKYAERLRAAITAAGVAPIRVVQ